MKEFVLILFITIGLPVILPIGIIIFWVRCGINFAKHISAWLDSHDEPIDMVENINHNEYNTLLMNEAGRLIKEK